MSLALGLDVHVIPGMTDALLVVGPLPTTHSPFAGFQAAYADAKLVDHAVGEECVLVACSSAPGRRLVLAPTGPLNRDYDDVRRCGKRGWWGGGVDEGDGGGGRDGGRQLKSRNLDNTHFMKSKL